MPITHTIYVNTPLVWLQPAAAVRMRSSLSWDFTQHWLVVCYCCCRTSCQSHTQGQAVKKERLLWELTLKMKPAWSETTLPIITASHPRGLETPWHCGENLKSLKLLPVLILCFARTYLNTAIRCLLFLWFLILTARILLIISSGFWMSMLCSHKTTRFNNLLILWQICPDLRQRSAWEIKLQTTAETIYLHFGFLKLQSTVHNNKWLPHPVHKCMHVCLYSICRREAAPGLWLSKLNNANFTHPDWLWGPPVGSGAPSLGIQ